MPDASTEAIDYIDRDPASDSDEPLKIHLDLVEGDSVPCGPCPSPRRRRSACERASGRLGLSAHGRDQVDVPGHPHERGGLREHRVQHSGRARL